MAVAMSRGFVLCSRAQYRTLITAPLIALTAVLISSETGDSTHVFNFSSPFTLYYACFHQILSLQ